VSNLRLPNISGAPGSVIQRDPAQATDKPSQVNGNNASSAKSFDHILGSELTKPVRDPLKFSAHATARLQSRNLELGPDQMRKLNEAVDKAAAKGLDDTLVLTPDAAFIVSVKNRTVVTAMDRKNLEGNVFTNIDGAIII
jgi:flagellar operon protein